MHRQQKLFLRDSPRSALTWVIVSHKVSPTFSLDRPTTSSAPRPLPGAPPLASGSAPPVHHSWWQHPRWPRPPNRRGRRDPAPQVCASRPCEACHCGSCFRIIDLIAVCFLLLKAHRRWQRGQRRSHTPNDSRRETLVSAHFGHTSRRRAGGETATDGARRRRLRSGVRVATTRSVLPEANATRHGRGPPVVDVVVRCRRLSTSSGSGRPVCEP